MTYAVIAVAGLLVGLLLGRTPRARSKSVVVNGELLQGDGRADAALESLKRAIAR